MSKLHDAHSERALVLAPLGRDASIAAALLAEAGIPSVICRELGALLDGLETVAGMAIVTEEAVRTADLSAVGRWIAEQPPWSDLPFVLLVQRGGGPERNPAAGRLSEVLGNVTFLERPFHPTTLVSVARAALRGRRRQYEARTRLEALRAGEEQLKAALLAEQHGAARQQLLINELNHRVKNTLATVQSIVMQTLRNTSSGEEAREALEARLMALSRVHDVLTQESWEGADLEEVVAQAVAPFGGRESTRFHIEGPAVRLSPHMSLAIAMALQELATNAVKYGALSRAVGTVAIEWGVTNGATPPRLMLRWSEQGGPAVSAPERRGFGTRLIERHLARDLDGTVRVTFEPSGVVCTVEAPLSS